MDDGFNTDQNNNKVLSDNGDNLTKREPSSGQAVQSQSAAQPPAQIANNQQPNVVQPQPEAQYSPQPQTQPAQTQQFTQDQALAYPPSTPGGTTNPPQQQVQPEANATLQQVQPAQNPAAQYAPDSHISTQPQQSIPQQSIQADSIKKNTKKWIIGLVILAAIGIIGVLALGLIGFFNEVDTADSRVYKGNDFTIDVPNALSNEEFAEGGIIFMNGISLALSSTVLTVNSANYNEFMALDSGDQQRAIDQYIVELQEEIKKQLALNNRDLESIENSSLNVPGTSSTRQITYKFKDGQLTGDGVARIIFYDDGKAYVLGYIEVNAASSQNVSNDASIVLESFKRL